MIILEKCFKDATRVDKGGKKWRAKTTCVVKRTPFSETFYLTNGMQVSRSTCFERVTSKNKWK